jgi:tRNA dimethylallyltransferase
MVSNINKIYIICGATASGKSQRAIDIAKEINGVIINADAMQIYQEISVITARPNEIQLQQAPHKLYGVMSVKEKSNAAIWLELAKSEIKTTIKNNQSPIITGGTGLYIKALMEGLSPIPDIAEEIRQQATNLYQENGIIALQRIDAKMAEKLKQNDVQRHIRAIEVMLQTGKSLSYWQEIPRIKPFENAEFIVEYININRAELYQRCNIRFLQMLKTGALEEAKAIYAMNLNDNLPAKRAVGLSELLKFINGEYNLETAITKAQQATRNYAKRQMTWFNNQLKL